MKNINNYIIEKLHLKKGINKTVNPFASTDFTKPEDLLNWIVETFEQDGCGGHSIWDDTEEWNVRDEYEDFTTTDGSDIDWTESFGINANEKMIAIWDISKEREKTINNHPFTVFFKSEFEEETLYKKQGYFVKCWGDFDYKDNIHIQMLIATPGEYSHKIIAFVIC